MKISIRNLVFFFSLLSIPSFSQQKLVPGYIINERGDTTKGFIDYQNWDKNPKSISFKLTIDDKIKKYNPLNIKEFGTNEDKYESAIIDIETSSNNISNLDINSYLKLQKDTAFLQIIVDGRQRLYLNKTYYKDNFYIKSDTTINLLIYKKFYNEEKQGIDEFNKYKGQLAYYFKDCPRLSNKIEHLKYEYSDLKDIFSSYLECTNSNTTFKNKDIQNKYEFGFIGGLTITEFKTQNNLIKFSNSKNITGGFFINVIFPRNFSKYSLYNDLKIVSYSVEGNASKLGFFEKEKHYKLALSYIKLQTMIKAKYPLRYFSVYVNAGMSHGFVIKESNNSLTIKTEYQPTIINSKKTNAFNIRKYEQGLVLGTGINYNNYAIEFRYEIGNGISYAEQVKTFTKNFNFLLSYKL